MRSTFKYLAWLIALEVAIQAAAIAFGVFGLGKWVGEGNAFTEQALEGGGVTGGGGFGLHAVNGMIIIPLIALILLIVSFFAKMPHASRDAGVLLGLVIVQVLLGFSGDASPWLGALHGLVALAIFGMASMLGVRVALTDHREAAAEAAPVQD